MVSIAVEALQGGRTAIASLSSIPHGDIKAIFAHSLLASGVEGIAQLPTAKADRKEKAISSEAEASMKDDVADQNVPVIQTRYVEIEPGPSDVKVKTKSNSAGSSKVAIVKGRSVEKGEPVGKAKGVPNSESKRLEVSEPMNNAKIVNGTVTSDKTPATNRKADTDSTVEDKAQVSDTTSVPSQTSEIEASGFQNSLNDPAIQQPIPSGSTVTDKNDVSVPLKSPVVTAVARHVMSVAATGGHPVKMPECADDATTTEIAKAEQTKSGAVFANTDLAATGAAGAVKTEAGIGAVAQVLHRDSGSPRQDGSLVVHSDDKTANSESTVHQSLVSETTPSLNSHNVTYGDGQGATNESRPALLAATPTSLEVGVANGTHGWLKIRAEMEGGVVTASLSSGSAMGQETLHRELPSIAAYLQDEKVSVNTLVIKQTQAMDTGASNSDGFMQRQGQPSEQGSYRTNGGVVTDDKSAWGGSEQEAMYDAWGGFGAGGGFLPAMDSGNGSWLNVRV
jgi:hypothetical protein